MTGQLLMVIGNTIALTCSLSMVMHTLSPACLRSGGKVGSGQTIVSSIVSMALVPPALSPAWHLSWAITALAAVTPANILCGFNTPEAQLSYE